jgi:hypothetical protein
MTKCLILALGHQGVTTVLVFGNVIRSMKNYVHLERGTGSLTKVILWTNNCPE